MRAQVAVARSRQLSEWKRADAIIRLPQNFPHLNIVLDEGKN